MDKLLLLHPKSNGYSIEKFLHEIIDEFCNRGIGIERLSEKLETTDENSLFSSVVNQVIISVKECIQSVFSKGIALEQLKDFLKETVPSNTVELLFTVISSRYTELKQSFSTFQSIEKLSSSYLADFDWKLHLTIASDKASQIREPKLLLNLYIHENDWNKTRGYLLEMNPKELDHVLKEFEKIERVINKVCV